MDHLIEAQRKLVPEMMEVLQARYNILKYVKMAGPIGRRPLGEMAGLSERETRTMLDFLRTQHLIDVAKKGATITGGGLDVLDALAATVDQWSGRNTVADRLTKILGIREVNIVAGDCEQDIAAKNLLGMEAADVFTSSVGNGGTVAVTGGSTVASISSYIENKGETEGLHFVAARGGVGDDIGLQANVIAASFAKACGGTYSTFYYPESLSEEAHEAFQREPSVVKMVELYDSVDCVVHGIGNAQKMASLRGSSEQEKKMLQKGGAKGEAFGYYFNRKGKVVYRIRTVGIQTTQLERVPLLIAVAGGASKAEAILSYLATAPKQTILVTDEGAANEMLSLLTQ